MLNLANELAAVVDTLNGRGVDFAVCGGVAMAIHGYTRATEDIDLFLREEDLGKLKDAVATLGFVIEARPMNFSGGAVKIRRISKIDPSDGDLLMLDLLLVTWETEHVWSTREKLEWRGKLFPVVSREGLIELKRYRSSEQDLLDIRKLESGE
jgi:predicted nucleotidyltransferase